jgi:hypothetical protein
MPYMPLPEKVPTENSIVMKRRRMAVESQVAIDDQET